MKDIYGAVERYERAKERLRDNPKLPKKNRTLAVEWLTKKEKELTDGLTKTDKETEKVRYTKTLTKYCILLQNVCHWFPDLSKITEKELEKFKDGFNNDRIKSIKGKTLKDKSDYYNKIIRSDFFKHHLGHRDIVEKVFRHKIRKAQTDVEFITLDDLKKMLDCCRYNYHKVALAVLFSTGMRIGELLNIKKKDLELKYNAKTEVYYYLCHVRKEYSKSKRDRTIPVLIPEAVDSLKKYMAKLQPDDSLINLGYSAVRNLILEKSEEAKILTKPNNKRPHLHVLRKSCAIHLLNNGYSLDQVKAYLGHKPSSTAIDCYVNYAGLKFEPEVTKEQTDQLVTLQRELEHNRMSMSALQEQNQAMQEKMVLIEKALKVKELYSKAKGRL